MKLVLKTSNRTIKEMNEACDREFDEDVRRAKVLDILIVALGANGLKAFGNSDIKWAYFESLVLNRLRNMRSRMLDK